VDTLKNMVYEVIRGYTAPALNGKTFLTTNETQDVFAVLFVGTFLNEHIADAGLIVRIEDDVVIVEQDLNNKPFVDAIVQAGIPRDKIVLAYAGETLANTTSTHRNTVL
jgi:hypothetical protein